jgi:AcrR family transcriptional regulator
MSSRRNSDRRTSILSAARIVLARKGFDGARAEDFAGEADVSPGLLFRHFPTLKALREAVLVEGLSRKASPLPKTPSGLGPRTSLNLIGNTLLSTFRDDPQAVRLALYGALAGNRKAVEPCRRGILRAVRRVRFLARSWQRCGWLDKTVHPDSLAWLFVSSMLHLAMAEIIFGLRISRATVTRTIEVFIAMMADGRQGEGSPAGSMGSKPSGRKIMSSPLGAWRRP